MIGWQPDPRPARRVKADVVRWELLRAEKMGPCRICRDAPEPWYGHGITLHHLVPRSLSGDDVPNNLVPLCGSGTTGCHGNVEHRVPEALAALRESLTDDETRYVTEKKGADFLERYYPVERAA